MGSAFKWLFYYRDGSAFGYTEQCHDKGYSGNNYGTNKFGSQGGSCTFYTTNRSSGRRGALLDTPEAHEDPDFVAKWEADHLKYLEERGYLEHRGSWSKVPDENSDTNGAWK